ncbi:MAG: chemotaxis protein CheX [Treponema sp.]|nr:chemotaxis protein CheX [Treponema sp.]
MDVKIINPFLAACTNAFQSMFSISPTAKAPYVMEIREGHPWEISGILGLTGDYYGVVAFRLHKILANKLLDLSGVSSDKPEEKEELSNQLVSEFTNIVAGNAASAIRTSNIGVSPPVVISGHNHVISWPHNYPVIAIPFVTQFGPFEVDVCFK